MKDTFSENLIKQWNLYKLRKEYLMTTILYVLDWYEILDWLKSNRN